MLNFRGHNVETCIVVRHLSCDSEAVNGAGEQTEDVPGRRPARSMKVSAGSQSAVSCKKIPNVLIHCHTEGMGACGRAHLSFGMTPSFPKKKKKKNYFQPCAPILLLV